MDTSSFMAAKVMIAKKTGNVGSHSFEFPGGGINSQRSGFNCGARSAFNRDGIRLIEKHVYDLAKAKCSASLHHSLPDVT